MSTNEAAAPAAAGAAAAPAKGKGGGAKKAKEGGGKKAKEGAAAVVDIKSLPVPDYVAHRLSCVVLVQTAAALVAASASCWPKERKKPEPFRSHSHSQRSGINSRLSTTVSWQASRALPSRSHCRTGKCVMASRGSRAL